MNNNHMTTGFVTHGFLYVVNLNQPSTLHGCQAMARQRFWGHDADLLGSRDVIGHVATGLAIWRFLYVVFRNVTLSHMVAEILCVKHSAKHIPIENALLPF